MNTKPFFLIVLYFSALGILLSGYLTYSTYFGPSGCSQALITCGGDTPVKIFGVTQCVYGLVLFAVTTIIASLGLRKDHNQKLLMILVWLGVFASVFAASLSVYELWIRIPRPTTMPSCVYGFFLYLGILLTSHIARNENHRPE